MKNLLLPLIFEKCIENSGDFFPILEDFILNSNIFIEQDLDFNFYEKSYKLFLSNLKYLENEKKTVLSNIEVFWMFFLIFLKNKIKIPLEIEKIIMMRIVQSVE